MRAIMQKIKKWVRYRGFTLVELLVAIGILAAISSVAVLTLNPAELFKQSRDANRFSSLASLKKAINLFQLNPGAPSQMGTPGIVYVSLPDENSDCSSWSGLGSGYTYRCVPSADLTKANGAGWIPINFEGEGRPLLPALPIDPVNSFYDPADPTSGYFYIYATDGTGKYEINAKTESVKYGGGG